LEGRPPRQRQGDFARLNKPFPYEELECNNLLLHAKTSFRTPINYLVSSGIGLFGQEIPEHYKKGAGNPLNGSRLRLAGQAAKG